MTFLKKFRKPSREGRKKGQLSRLDSFQELEIPANFICPISLEMMKDPVTLSTGITYDRESIERWLDSGNETCPVTNQATRGARDHLIPNHALRKVIQDWCVENKSRGVERIPTPRIPVSASQVSDVCGRIEAAARRGDGGACLELVGKIKVWGRESERNRKCIKECGGACGALVGCFEHFAGFAAKHSELLRELMSVLTWMLPIGGDSISKLGAKLSLQCMIWFVKGEDLLGAQNALVILKELLYFDRNYTNTLLEIDQYIPERISHIVKVPICPSDKATTKAALTVMHHMIASEPKGKTVILPKLLEADLVPKLLELLVDSDKSVCHKALALLDLLCSSKEGRQRALAHPLTMPLLVKKIMRVSEFGTELCISTIWKLCKEDDDGEGPTIEALELGAFQKLLVVLQVGCGERSKEKATELLKLMNVYKDRVECFNSFKYLKRSY